MRLSTARVLPFLSVVPFVHANNLHHHRQVAAASSSSASGPAAPAAASSAASSPLGSSAALSGTVSGTLLPTPTGPTPSFTLVAENPTAFPLSSIVVNAPSAATSIMPTPYPAGTKPSYLPNAPGLPDREHFTYIFPQKMS